MILAIAGRTEIAIVMNAIGSEIASNAMNSGDLRELLFIELLVLQCKHRWNFSNHAQTRQWEDSLRIQEPQMGF